MSQEKSISRTGIDHRLNCWADHFDAIVSGLKTSDVRRTDDRANVMPGDTVTFLRVDKKTGEPTYVGPDGQPATEKDEGARVQTCKVLVTHKTDTAGELGLFGIKVSDFNRPGLIVPIVALSITVLE